VKQQKSALNASFLALLVGLSMNELAPVLKPREELGCARWFSPPLSRKAGDIQRLLSGI
jgi:hypothetical protein